MSEQVTKALSKATAQTVAIAPADCWSTIGVRGDLSCAELAEHVHCRHCPVHEAGARRILARPVDEIYRADWAAELRQPRTEAEPPDASAVVFRIGAEWLAVASGMVASVAPAAAVHRVPHRSGGALLGIVNVGGRLLPALSLAEMLGIDEHQAAAVGGRHVFARLLILDCAGQLCALPAAELKGVVRYASARLAGPAATINKGLQRHLAGVLEHDSLLVGVLDPEVLAHHCAGLLR
ncbi:chemotaxis protein CheW [Massilia sp. H6]|uniref:chemotaxis protein CheW n=1 Tax=Massilia sp. H6 TaxID=2970464 RepID=UPI00216A8B36|nr:chemotaxis protein CheW [Massilia sp. H6]UVW27720.1 chemotaxis protein CheW [Massilia sp. H6]